MSSESASKAKPKRALKTRIHQNLRWLHTYLSMFTMLVVLFFAVTGVTLNHPEWTFGGAGSERKIEGTLKAGAIQGETVDWLVVAEQLRHDGKLRGMASDNRVDAGEGSISFRGPGFASDCFFKLDGGQYECSITDQGALGLMNDLHRGRDSGPAWAWLVDLSGVFLCLVSLTGFGIIFYLKKSKVAGLVLVGVGLAVVLVLAATAMR